MKKNLIALMSACLIAFYIGIVAYILLGILHIEKYNNFMSAVLFEIIGFLMLGHFVISNILSKRIKTGYFVPIIMITVIYTVILDVINIVCVRTMPNIWFVLVNIVLLFVYCLVLLPMYMMGKNN